MCVLLPPVIPYQDGGFSVSNISHYNRKAADCVIDSVLITIHGGHQAAQPQISGPQILFRAFQETSQRRSFRGRKQICISPLNAENALAGTGWGGGLLSKQQQRSQKGLSPAAPRRKSRSSQACGAGNKVRVKYNRRLALFFFSREEVGAVECGVPGER